MNIPLDPELLLLLTAGLLSFGGLLLLLVAALFQLLRLRWSVLELLESVEKMSRSVDEMRRLMFIRREEELQARRNGRPEPDQETASSPVPSHGSSFSEESVSAPPEPMVSGVAVPPPMEPATPGEASGHSRRDED